MFRRLTDWYIDRLVAKQRANLPVVDARSLHERIAGEIPAGGSFYLETRDQRFVPVDLQQLNSEGLDSISLIVTWSGDGIKPWETEEPAKEVARRLSERSDIEAMVFLSRRLDAFVGYYVRIRPKLP